MEGRTTNLLKHAGAVCDFFDHVVVEEGLREDGQGLVLGFDAQILALEVDFHAIDVLDAALGLGFIDDPAAQLVVSVGTAVNVIAVFIGVIQGQCGLEVARKVVGASFDGRLGGVDAPRDLLLLDGAVEIFGFGVDATSQFIVAAGCDIDFFRVLCVVRIASLRRGMTIAIWIGFAVLLHFATGFLVGTVLSFPFLGLALQDEGAQLETSIDIGALTTGFAVQDDASLTDHGVGLGILAFLAEDEAIDEAIQMVLELGSLMGAVDDPAVVVGISVGLSAKFEAEILDEVCETLDFESCLRYQSTHSLAGGSKTEQRCSD